MIKEKSADDIPAVQEFMQAKEILLRFKQQHAKVFEAFAAIAEDYNQKLEAAEKACRSQGVGCGPFDFYQEQITIDEKALYEWAGTREKFVAVGGQLSTVTTKKADKAKVLAAIKTGVIPKTAAVKIVKTSPRYHIPDKVNL